MLYRIRFWKRRSLLNGYKMNTINIELKKLPKDVHAWVDYEIAVSNSHDIPVKLLSKKHVWIDRVRCHGYFCSTTPELVVACYMEENEWVQTMVHESCHRDQFVEKTAIWNKKIELDGEKRDPLELMHSWLEHEIELKPRKLKEVLMACMNIELDCEIRAAKKIDEFYLPINHKEYVQKANAYAYLYHVLGHTRLWYPKGKSPFYLADVWTKMPTDFDRDYTKIPTKIKNLMLTKCYNKRV